MKRAFVYCRVSTEEQSQDDHYSLALQEERCRDYAKSKSWRVAKVRKDVGSGRNGDRPGFQELLQDVSAGAIDVVIVYRLDRLSRNVRDVYDFLERTRQADVGFVSTSEAFDTTCAMGRAMLGVAAVFSQLTREMIGENTRDGMAKRARSGKYTGSTGNPPYGYSYSTAEGKLLVDPAEAEVVRRVFDLYGHRKWGYMKIAQHLNQEGVPPRMKGAQWSPRRLAAMLRSPVYIGKLPYQGNVFDGEHEPIIDPGLFGEVQALLASRQHLPPRTQQSRHLLSGIARCGQCGGRLSAHWILYRGKSTRRYRAYKHRGNVYAGDRACPGFTKAADRLEAAVVDKVRELAASPGFQEAAFQAARKQLASDAPLLQQERDEVQGQLSDMAAQFARWAERLDAGKIDEEQFTERNAALLKQKAKLQDRLAELDARLAEQEGIEVSLEEVRGMLRDFGTVWDHLTLDEQREMLRALIEELNVWKDRAELKLVLMPAVGIDVQFAQRGAKGDDGTRTP
jgi:site-specific DNA recombinase